MQTPIEQAIASAGSMAKLAKILGITRGAVSQWKLPLRVVPAHHCPTIEKHTSVPCELLRPDIDWSFIRNTHKKHSRSKARTSTPQNIDTDEAGK